MAATTGFIEGPRDEIERSLAARFEMIVYAFGERVAVKSGPHALTYEALNQAANRVARAILARCYPDELPIALLFDRGLPAVVAMLGALKAAKACAILDPALPRDRLAAIMADLRMSPVVTSRRYVALARRLPQDAHRVINLDELDQTTPATNLDLTIAPDQLAAIFYNLENLAPPSGVMCHQRALLHRAWQETLYGGIRAGDNIALLYAADPGALPAVAFTALLNGATLCLPDAGQEGLEPMIGWLAQQGITHLTLPLAWLHHFCQALAGRRPFLYLRQVTLTGRSAGRISGCQEHFPPGCRLVWPLAWAETGLVGGFDLDGQAVATTPAARPAPGVTVLLGDQVARQGLPIGAAGEIVIRGHSLSPGYWRKPGLTQRRFTATPTGDLLYHTGELGRWLPDGRLQWLGTPQAETA